MNPAALPSGLRWGDSDERVEAALGQPARRLNRGGNPSDTRMWLYDSLGLIVGFDENGGLEVVEFSDDATVRLLGLDPFDFSASEVLSVLLEQVTDLAEDPADPGRWLSASESLALMVTSEDRVQVVSLGRPGYFHRL
jgi:hypothetical protein